MNKVTIDDYCDLCNSKQPAVIELAQKSKPTNFLTACEACLTDELNRLMRKPLTVAQLAKRLQGIPQDLIVVIPSTGWYNPVVDVLYHEGQPLKIDLESYVNDDGGTPCVSLETKETPD